MWVADVLLPQSDMGMQDGEIISWQKSVGDVVEKNEVT